MGAQQAAHSSQQRAKSALVSGLASGAMAAFSDKNSKKNVKSYSDKEKKKNIKSTSSYSDENAKENIKSNDDSHSPKSFLDALQAYSYEYKDPKQSGAGEGRHLSVMAQDLEKAGPVGKQMVQNTEQGKMVDYGKGFGAMLANQVHLNERLSAMEPSKKKKKS